MPIRKDSPMEFLKISFDSVTYLASSPTRSVLRVEFLGADRPSWELRRSLKARMLINWFKLSDPGLEEAPLDLISFRRQRLLVDSIGAKILGKISVIDAIVYKKYSIPETTSRMTRSLNTLSQ